METQSLFLRKIKQQYKEQLLIALPNLPKEKIDEIVEKEIVLGNQDIVFDDEQELLRKNTNLLEVSNFLEDNKPIISGFGTLYKNHNEQSNLLAHMFDFLLKERKVVKKEMFKHIKDVDKTIYDNLNLIQLTYKLLANSGFGATIEKNSYFYNKYFGSAVTASGQVIIMTALCAFEDFLANNFYFYTLDDLTLYIRNITKENYTKTDPKFKEDISKEKFSEYILSKFKELPNKELTVAIYNIINSLSQEEINKIYFKNNLYEFFRYSEITQKLKPLMTREFLDPNEPPEENVTILEEVWEYLNDWVLYNYMTIHRYKRSAEEERRAVIIVDTDSNFLHVDPFFKFFKDFFPDEKIDEDNITNVISIVNISTFFLTNVIKNIYWTLATNMNIPEDKRSIINMKNEFYYSRIMNTRNKKSYAGSKLMQEGKLFDTPEYDIKGLAIRKVSVNSSVRNYFTRVLKEFVLDPKEIDLSNLIAEFKKLEDLIASSLLNGESEFLLPIKVNEFDSYKNPYQMMSVRGTLIWNALFPNETIVPPGKINFIKLKNFSREELIEKLPEDVFSIIDKNIYQNENMARFGFSILSIPKSVKKLPDWLKPLIDVNTMVNDHVKSGMIILESAEFNVLEILDSQFPSNILSF